MWSHHAYSVELTTNLEKVICSVMKWCWSRLAGGVVTWEAYELFKIGEQGMHGVCTSLLRQID